MVSTAFSHDFPLETRLVFFFFFCSRLNMLLRLLSTLRIAAFRRQLVNYTANLTEERDELNANLEEAKKALQREMATRIALESKGHMPQGRKVRHSSTALPCLASPRLAVQAFRKNEKEASVGLGFRFFVSYVVLRWVLGTDIRMTLS